MKRHVMKLLAISLTLALLVSGLVFQAPALAAPTGMTPDNPFIEQAQVFTNDNFAFPRATQRLTNNTGTPNTANPTWTNAAWKANSQVIHDTGIYYEDGWYYGSWTNDTGTYRSRDMLNWIRVGLRPYGWRNNEPLHVTWAPELIELKQPFVWPQDGSANAGKSFKYAMWDSLSIYGQPASRVRLWVSNTLIPAVTLNGRGAATMSNWQTTGLNNVASGLGHSADGWQYVYDTIGCGIYAQAYPADNWTYNNTGTATGSAGNNNGNPRPAGETLDGFGEGVATVASKFFILSGQSVNANGGSTNFNTIDSNIIYDKEGKMWMCWGSYTNGIWIAELDQATLRPVSNAVSSYTQIARIGSEEAPNIIFYDPDGEGPDPGWYYLCITRDNLMSSYNSRVGRSRDVTGPYLDANGRSLLNAGTNTAGTKVAGPYAFGSDQGWLAQGHIQWVYNSDTNEYFIVSNGRPVGNTGSARQMIRPVLWTESGWPLFSPGRASADQTQSQLDGSGNAVQAAATVTSKQTVPTALIPGAYQTVFHRRASTRTTAAPSFNITLHEDYTITGSLGSPTADTGSIAITSGYWAQTTPTQVMMRINGITYEAVFNASWDWENDGSQGNGLTFAALSEAGSYTDNAYGAVVWGKQVPPAPAEEVLAAAKAALTLPAKAYTDIALPASVDGAGNSVAVTWASGSPNVISDAGIVNRPTSGEDITVMMTATLTYRGATDTKVFEVVAPVKSLYPVFSASPSVYMAFEDNYNNSVTGASIRHATVAPHANTAFTAGKIGRGLTAGARRTGSVTGNTTSVLRLIDNVVAQSNYYTISMWINGSAFTDHTAVLHMRKGSSGANNGWLNLQPRLASSGNAGFRFANTPSGGSEAWYDIDSGIRLNTNTWYMMTFVYDNGKADLYIDGQWRAGIASGVPNPRGTGTLTTWIGGNEWDGTFQGVMDEFYIFTSALNPDDIALLYAVNKDTLAASITEFESIDKSGYTSGSWKAAQDAYAAALLGYEENDATQAEVNAAALALNDAIGELEQATLDFGTGQPAALTLKRGQVFQIKISSNNKDEVLFFSANGNVTISPSGLVTGVKPGVAIITVVDTWSGQFFSIVINVTN